MVSSKEEHVQINFINKDKGSIFEDQNKTKRGSFCGLSLAIFDNQKKPPFWQENRKGGSSYLLKKLIRTDWSTVL